MEEKISRFSPRLQNKSGSGLGTRLGKHSVVIVHFTTQIFCYTDSQGIAVSGVSKDMPARQCGLKYDDVILMFAVVNSEKVGNPIKCCGTDDGTSQFKRALSEAATNSRSLILAITRPISPVTRV